MPAIGLGLSLTLSRLGGGFSTSAFAAAKSAIEADVGNVNMLVIGDSTGNDVGEWPRLFMAWLASEYPTHTVEDRLFNTTSGNYDAATVVATGSGANKITLWNYSVAGARPVRSTGSEHANAIAALSPNLIIWNHGHNVYSAGLTDAHYRSEFFAAFEETRTTHPTVPTAIILQNPRRDTDVMAGVIAALQAVAPYYGTVVDVYSEFIAQGKNPALYVDDIHPSTGEAGGSGIFLTKMQQAWEAASAPATVAAAHTATKVTNLLANGDFADWSGAIPASWFSSVSAVATKELTIVEGASPYSLKLTGTSAGAGMFQIVPNVADVQGKEVFLAVRMRVPSGQASTVGRIYFRYTVGTNTITTSRAQTYGTDRFCWQMLGPISVPAGATEARVFLYCDTAANAASQVLYDRAILVANTVPRDMA